MDADVRQVIDATGVCIPLAARIVKLLVDSGASKMEMGIALEIADRLRVLIPGALWPTSAEESVVNWTDGPGTASGGA